ncbi:GUN4 domain-containing protein [Trichocoleus sp. ST-U3]|uniref:GUN4 domain-containing protein n=1 Tax=Coleofasciculus sp. FACHB-542 TaxID=2692787 RepID=UPI001686DD71|nr:GUN4 domain-containing protein [Coleofasciculus sp. FACHB-542]MBD2088011.1 GUN4 domain-containing protein [Coleofasciculus sp. FACHB-542]
MSKAGAGDWKTPLGYYERAIAELERTREQFQAEIQILKELQASQEGLKAEFQTEIQTLKSEIQNSKQALEATKAELQATKAELQNTNKRFDNLAKEVTKAQTIAEYAYVKSNEAETTANRANSEIESVKANIENGTIIAHKAIMLQGKDDQHWMRFCKLDSVNNHCFQVWKSNDDTWHKISGLGVDYRKLEQLLAAGNWREADEETFNKMLEVAGREKEGCLRNEDIDKFFCEDLHTIDQLWVKYSNGHFGLSVQNHIYKNLGGTIKYDSKIWQDFGDRVGWRANNQSLWYRYVNFSTAAPSGHLPARIWDDWGGGGVGSFYSLASKLLSCNI